MKSVLIMLFLLFSSSAVMAEPEPMPGEKPCEPGDPRPRCMFDFDEDGQVKTESGIAERTFNFPPLKVGFIFDVNHKNVLPYGAIQVVEWDMFGEMFSTNIGASWSRVFVDLQWIAVPIMYIGPSIWAGYNVGEEDWAAGIGVSILKF